MICFYCISTQLGGAEKSLLEFLISWVRSGGINRKPWVIVPHAEGPLVSALRDAGIEVTVLPMPSGMLRLSRQTPFRSAALALGAVVSFPGYFISLLNLLRERRPELLHTTGIKCHGVGAWAARLLGIPVIWHLRDILPPGPTRSLLRVTGRLAGVHLICNSRATRDAIGLSLRGREVRVIYNGLPGSYRSARHRELAPEFGIPASAPIVGMMGVLARWKGQLEFIRMAGRLVESGSAAHFLIVGSRIYETEGDRNHEQELFAELDRLGLGDRVHFAGFRKDVVQILNGIDVLVHASIRPEPFGRVVLEAMACETPVVATRGGGIDEFVEEGETGLLVDPGNVEQMARAVSRILGDPALRMKLVETAKRRFDSAFTMDSHLAAIRDTYSSLLP